MAASQAAVAKPNEEPSGEPKGWRPLANPIPRFLAKVRYLESDCWEWAAARYRGGYGVFAVGDTHGRYAHRWSYFFFVGNIPDGYVVDHLCRNPTCVNPDHLDAVPVRVNTMRGRLPEVTRARAKAQSHCKRGHRFDKQNTYHHPNGRRVCRACFREYDQLWARARRAGLPTKRPNAEQSQPCAASPKGRRGCVGDVKERFLSKVESAPSGCWNWAAGRFPTGYGKFRVGRTGTAYAHRWSYQLFVGSIPEGTEIDHLCGNRGCVNPTHLEPVKHSENVRRGSAWHNIAALHKAKTHCPRGHPYDEENTYRNPRGERACRTCQRLHARAWYWRKKSRGDE
jgi:hypothetical protein